MSKIKLKCLFQKYDLDNLGVIKTYTLIKKVIGIMDDTEIVKKTNLIIKNDCLVIPWLNDFPLGWLNKKQSSKFMEKLVIKND